MDTDRIRREFPILEQKVNNRELIYLDNAATTQMPDRVLNTFLHHYHTVNANAHRAQHYLGGASTKMIEEVRARTARFIGAEGSRNIIFTAGTTAAVHLAAGSYAEPRLGPGKMITASVMEHHSNYLPWMELCNKHGAVFRTAGIAEDGHLDLDELCGLLKQHPVLCAVTACSNVTGTVNPIREITKTAHEQGVPVLVDAAQYIREHEFNVKESGVDFLCFSAHKMMGPSGLGILYASDEMLEKMLPYNPGGGTVYDIKDGVPQYEEPPACFEAGTANIGAVAAFGETLCFLEETGRKEISRKEHSLTRMLIERLNRVPEISVLGPDDEERGSCVSISVKGMHFYDLAVLMDKQGVAVRSGNHCAVPYHQALGLSGSLRFSPAFYNTEEEIEKAMKALLRSMDILRMNS